MTPIKEVLEASNVNSSDIQKLVLCGGTTKIPKLQKTIHELFSNAELFPTTTGPQKPQLTSELAVTEFMLLKDIL